MLVAKGLTTDAISLETANSSETAIPEKLTSLLWGGQNAEMKEAKLYFSLSSQQLLNRFFNPILSIKQKTWKFNVIK